jgi:hypothetical protein
MATVRLSQSLINDILDNAGKTQDKAIARAVESRPSHDWAEEIYNTLLGDSVALAEKLPEHWFDMVDSIRLRSIGSLDGSMLEFKFTAPKRWPRNIDNALGKKSYGGVNVLDLHHSLVWGTLHADVAAWVARVIAAQNRKREFISGVKKILSNHATLAPALKAWPPLWDFIPEDVKVKHKEVSTRGKKPEVKHDVDISKLTSMAVAAKIG